MTMSKGLTMTMIFLAESANYGESLGNVATLKKLPVEKGNNTPISLAKRFAITLSNNWKNP